MVVTDDGSDTEIYVIQLEDATTISNYYWCEKASPPIVVTDGGNVTETNDLRPWEILWLILVIDGGSDTKVNDVQ